MSVNQSWGCSKCEKAFKSKEDLVAHVASHKVKTTVTKAKPTPVVQKKVTPIQLTYVYKGLCNKCGGTLSTIELDVAKKHFAIALCSRCNTQCETKEVVKL